MSNSNAVKIKSLLLSNKYRILKRCWNGYPAQYLKMSPAKVRSLLYCWSDGLDNMFTQKYAVSLLLSSLLVSFQGSSFSEGTTCTHTHSQPPTVKTNKALPAVETIWMTSYNCIPAVDKPILDNAFSSIFLLFHRREFRCLSAHLSQ